jgi:hypothetical protein
MWSTNANNVINFSTSSSLRLTIGGAGGTITSAIPYLGPAGTVTAPTYSFTGAATNGFWRSGTNQVSVSTNGIETMRWNADQSSLTLGPLGVTGALTATGEIAGQGYACKAGTAGALQGNYHNIEDRSGVAHLWIDTTDFGAVTLGGPYLPLSGGALTGALGVGTAPGYLCHVRGVGTGAPNDYILMVDQTHNTAGDKGVVVCVGATGSDTTSQCVSFYDGAISALQGAIARNGAANVAYGTSSDQRLKEAISDSQIGLEELMQIKVREYNFKTDTRQEHGLIAQEVHGVYPLAVVVGGDDPGKEPWMIDYGRLTPLLIKAIQQQQEILQTTLARIAVLENA